jgi:pyruvate formate lyase activating enzyme
MENEGPLILEIKGNSLDDGPGIRTVVFFKGCPLACSWCHNPESRRVGVEISFDARECVGCDTCIGVCREGALDRSDPGFVDRRKCTLCFECTESCPSGALARVGRPLEVRQVVKQVQRDMPFFKTSGGGVTLSGGEPTLFIDYCSELLASLKELGIQTIVETCGYFDYPDFDRLVYPFADEIYYDLKLFDNQEHRRHCGVSNESILMNFAGLQERVAEGGKPLLPRIPLIPGITATDENLEQLAAFLRGNGVARIALLQYNPLWVEKTAKVGAANPLSGVRGMSTWMSSAEIRRCREIFKGFELVQS